MYGGFQDNTQPLDSYRKEMKHFFTAKQESGKKYQGSDDAYEDFKHYYDMKLKVAGQAGKQVVKPERARKETE